MVFYWIQSGKDQNLHVHSAVVKDYTLLVFFIELAPQQRVQETDFNGKQIQIRIQKYECTQVAQTLSLKSL